MRKYVFSLLFILGIFGLFMSLNRLLQYDDVILYEEKNFTTYENVLYSPEELESLPIDTESVTGVEHSYWHEDEFSRVRTSVINAKLEEGKIYGIYGENLTYAFNLYVNGKLIASRGKVTPTEEGFEAETGAFVAYFEAEKDNSIVVQRANWVHAKWNSFEFKLGSADAITKYAENSYFANVVILIMLLTMGLLNMGIFIGLKGQTHVLVFSLACLSMMVYSSFGGPKVVMLLFPDLNWQLGHKLESCSLILVATFLILFFEECFGKLKDIFRLMGAVFIGASFIYYAALPSTIYTKYSVIVSDVIILYSVAVCVYMLVRAIRRFKDLSLAQKYYLISILVLCISGLMAALRQGPYGELMKMALIISDIILIIGLAMEFRSTRDDLERAVRNEDSLKRMNEEMERTRNLQNNFLSIMNHEMRTPLTIIAGYAEKVKCQASKDLPDGSDALKDLDFIKQEALRLGRIVEQSEEGILDEPGVGEVTVLDVDEIFKKVKQFCDPICEKRGTSIKIENKEELKISGNQDSTLQLLYNLVLNASRHTEKGTIWLMAEKRDNDVLIKVKDSGTGMDDETMAHAFEKGYTKDGRHGLGLALCKDIVTKMGGSIWIEKNADTGVCFNILLPEIKN